MVFIDDILVDSKTYERHVQYLRFVLQRLQEKQLYANFSKCKLWLDQIAFLGHMVLTNNILVDLR